MYGSQASSKDLNLPFPVPPFNKQAKDGSDLDQQQQQQRRQQQQQQQQQHQMSSSGLLRYRSAPSSLLGEVCEEFLPHGSTSPEAAAAGEPMFVRFISPDHHLRHHQIGAEKPPPAPAPARSPQFMPPPPPPAMEHEGVRFSSTSASTQLLYCSQQQQQQQVAAASHSSAATAMEMEHEQIKGGANCPTNLIRHSSSPAGLFSHLNVENGFAVMRGGGGFRGGAGSNGEAALGGSRLRNQISFSRQSSSAGLMSQISEIEGEGIGGSSPEDNGMGNGSRCYIPGFPVASWEDSSLLSDSVSGLKRARDSLNPLEAQNGDVRNRVSGLSHQFSLPKTSSEIAAMEKYLQFQDSVPCKIRAKRGFATHPRSIAERVRRTRISERMRKLQELVPNMDKQTNTADMLDLAVDYIKDLQKQVKNLSESRSNCTCSNK